jgi:chemotaxis signal transduction protein
VPAWVLGVANVRGDIVSLVDLGAFLGLDGLPHGRPGRMVVARARPDELTAGLLVDQVRGIQFVPEDRISTASPVEGPVTPYLRGVAEQGGRLLVFLDLDRLLLSPAMRQFELV